MDRPMNGRPSFYFDTHKFITNPTLESNNNGALPAWNLNAFADARQIELELGVLEFGTAGCLNPGLIKN